VLGHILVEFLFRLAFGVATAMGLTDARQVTSGFFRVHLWVLLGLQTLAALALFAASPRSVPYAWMLTAQFWLAVAGAVLCYVGAVIWMYERAAWGKAAIALVAACSLAGMTLPLWARLPHEFAWHVAGRITGGWLLGFVVTAMLLGHWYLNTPTMKLAPLRWLILLLAAAVILRMVVCGAGLALEWGMHPQAPMPSWTRWLVFVALRWLAGLFGVGLLTGLTWQTLKIPNTQSATGILYAAVVLAFIGELMSQLLSTATHYPV
jgi:hypothetical protein